MMQWELDKQNKEKAIERKIDSEPNQLQKVAHLSRGIVSASKKYQNIKIQNFIETLFEKNVTTEQFAALIEREFYKHSLRKANIIQSLQEQLNSQKMKNTRLMSGKP